MSEVAQDVRLDIQLFGDVVVRINGQPLDLKHNKQKWLIGLLALNEGKELHRDILAEQIHPQERKRPRKLSKAQRDARARRIATKSPAQESENRGRESLKQTLSDLSKNLSKAKDRIEPSYNFLSFHRRPGDTIDVASFELAQSSNDFEGMVIHYHGKLLQCILDEPDLDIADDWVADVQYRHLQYQNAFVSAIEQLGRTALSKHSHDGYRRAIDLALKGLTATQDEGLYALLMEAHYFLGNDSEVINTFDDMRSFVGSPGPMTRDIYDRARHRRMEKLRSAAGVPRNPKLPVSEVRPGNLPDAGIHDTMVGREAELSDLRQLLTLNKVITLKGPSGIGKTHLALEFAHKMEGAYGKGAWYIDLTGIEASNFRTQLADGLAIYDITGLPAPHLINEELRDSKRLIIFDNCEQIIEECAQEILSMLAVGRLLSFVITSQVSLRIAPEHVYEVKPLDCPPSLAHIPLGLEGAAQISTYSAVKLLTRSISHPDRTFNVAENEIEDVISICNQTAGIPLFLKMAGAWRTIRSFADIRKGLQNCLRILKSIEHGSPAHHETALAVMEYSYSLLTPEERNFLTRFSVFESGCSFDALHTVCFSDTVPTEDAWDLVRAVKDKSLLETVAKSGTGEIRFRQHHILHEYGKQMLSLSGEISDIQQRHLDYYVEFVNDVVLFDMKKLPSERNIKAVSLLGDIPDIRAAFKFALISDKLKAIQLHGPLWVQNLGYGRYKAARESACEVFNLVKSQSTSDRSVLSLDADAVLTIWTRVIMSAAFESPSVLMESIQECTYDGIPWLGHMGLLVLNTKNDDLSNAYWVLPRLIWMRCWQGGYLRDWPEYSSIHFSAKNATAAKESVKYFGNEPHDIASYLDWVRAIPCVGVLGLDTWITQFGLRHTNTVMLADETIHNQVRGWGWILGGALRIMVIRSLDDNNIDSAKNFLAAAIHTSYPFYVLEFAHTLVCCALYGLQINDLVKSAVVIGMVEAVCKSTGHSLNIKYADELTRIAKTLQKNMDTTTYRKSVNDGRLLATDMATLHHYIMNEQWGLSGLLDRADSPFSGLNPIM